MGFFHPPFLKEVSNQYRECYCTPQYFSLSLCHNIQIKVRIFLKIQNICFRMLSFSNIYSINAWLLLSPSALCCDWSLGSIPLVSSLADWRNVWSILLYSGIGTVATHALFSRRDRIVAGMGLALVVLPFLPASGLIFRVGFVIAER